MERFRKAVESQSAEAVVACLAENVVLHSPVLFRPVVGRQAVEVVLRAVQRVLKDFRYVSELHGDSGTSALEFVAKVRGLELQGIDLGKVDQHGLVSELTVFMRPLKATQAFLDEMQVELGLQS